MSRARKRKVIQLLLLASVALLCASGRAASQPRPPRTAASPIEAVDSLVHGDRLVTLERERCDASRRYEDGECTSLIARDPASGAQLWRTPMPLRTRGLIQIDLADADGTGVGFLVRAHDRAVLVSSGGQVRGVFSVPTSTLPRPVGFREARGAFVFAEPGGCSYFVVGRTDLTQGVYVHGVESHVYGPGGGPHDTECFGFSVRPIGEVRVGTRPASRGRRGEIRHALAVRVLVAVTGLQHPVEASAPSVIAFERGRVVAQTAVGNDGAVLEAVAMTGSDRAARCSIDTFDGTTHRCAELECATAQVLARTTVSPTPDAAGLDAGVAPDAGAPIAYDRRGISLPRFSRCVVEESTGQHRVRFDGREALVSEHRILVLDQRADSCVAVELGERGDRVHVLRR